MTNASSVCRRAIDAARSLYKNATASPAARQTGVLYASNITSMLLQFAAGVVIARLLGRDGYGDLTFVQALLMFGALFPDLGLGDSAAKLLANTGQEIEQRRLTGGFLLLTFLSAALFSLVVALGSRFVDPVFGTQVGFIVQKSSWLAGAYVLQRVMLQVCKGLNRAGLLSFMNVMPFAWYAASALVLDYFGGANAGSLILARLSGALFSALVVSIGLRPSFDRASDSLRAIAKDIRAYGYKVYTGRVLNSAARQSDRLIIGLFDTTTSVGYYTIAANMVKPVTFLSESLVASRYRRFASQSRLSKKMFAVIVGWITVSATGLFILGPFLVETLFSAEFSSVVPLLLLAIAGAVLGSLRNPFNAFLGAHGQGGDIRRAALWLAAYDLPANLLLVYLFGAQGAVYSQFGETALSLALYSTYYRQYLRRGGACGGSPRGGGDVSRRQGV